MNHRRLTLLILLLAVLATSAQDILHQRGCRRGYLKPNVAQTRQAPQQLRQSRAAATGVNPYIGDRRQLVILAAYSDRSFQGDSLETLQKWEPIFNEEGYNANPYIGSIHDYFYDQSYGQFRLTFDLLYVTVGQASRYASTDYDDENSQFLVQDIVDSLVSRDIDWSPYDWEGDGYINQLLIVYAGKGMNEGASNTVWPHQGWLSKHINPKTKKNCEPELVTSGGQNYLVDSYCAVQEVGVSNNAFGTICHEYSHCLGLPDFYYPGQSYLTTWDLMDTGNYNGGGFVPCGYSAHERWFMGWLQLDELTESATISNMPALSDKPVAYVVYNDGYASECYVVENRQQKKWDAELPGSGIIIFHIDYDEELWKGSFDEYGNFKWANDPYGDQHCVIFHANNLTTYFASGWAYPYNDNNELTNTSTPAASLWHANTDGAKYMNKSITSIAVNDSVASFAFTPQPTGIIEIESQRPSASDAYFNLAGQRITTPTHHGLYIVNGRKVVR